MVPTVCFIVSWAKRAIDEKSAASIERLKTMCMILMPLSLIVIKYEVYLITVKHALFISH